MYLAFGCQFHIVWSGSVQASIRWWQRISCIGCLSFQSTHSVGLETGLIRLEFLKLTTKSTRKEKEPQRPKLGIGTEVCYITKVFPPTTASWPIFLLHVLHRLLCSVRLLPLRLPLYRIKNRTHIKPLRPRKGVASAMDNMKQQMTYRRPSIVAAVKLDRGIQNLLSRSFVPCLSWSCDSTRGGTISTTLMP